MLTIRKDQMAAFSANAQAQFALRCEAHLREYFPEECGRLGPREVAASVRLALGKADDYRLKSERDILRYLNLMYTLGFDFDRNVPWASGILTDGRLSSASKMRLLTERTLYAANDAARA